MFDRLKAVFGGPKPPEMPEKVWALTVLLNPAASKNPTPAEMVAFARRNADDLNERTHTLYFGGTDDAKTIALFSTQEGACDFVAHVCRQRGHGVDIPCTGFGMVLLRRESLHTTLAPMQNLRIFLDSFQPGERELFLTDMQRYSKQ